MKQTYKTITPALIFFIFIGLLGLLFDSPLDASIKDLEQFRKMAILENGRPMPLDTFAQNMLTQFSGQSRFQKQSAIYWLAQVLFFPDDTAEHNVFLVTNPEVLDSINVTRRGKARDRYSFNQLRPALPKLRELAVNASKLETNQRSFIENEIIGLYSKLYVYQQLLATFDFLAPHEDFTVQQEENRVLLGFPVEKKQFSFLDLLEKNQQLIAAATSQEDEAQRLRTPAEAERITLRQSMEKWSGFYSELPFTVIPHTEKDSAGTMKEKWFSPWDLVNQSLAASSDIPQELFLLRDIYRAYKENRQPEFDKAVSAFNRLILDKSGDGMREKALSMEVLYNKVDPFYKAEFFYGFAVIFLLLSFMYFPKWNYRLSFMLLSVGFLLQFLGIAARMYIRLRPPVTNLYETFLFTGLITALLGLILELSKHRNIGILTGGLSGLVMLLIAGKYALEGDTMGMLVAVLDSNFWLAFHVITIILGYAGVVLSGFIGHVYLVQRIFKPDNAPLLENTFQSVYAIQAFGIIFTFLGTVLGGIWADQSWGRFWGWDPKENGALLILLWAAILFHTRLAGWIKETGFAFGTIIGVICVSLAWFGVNLLGVGLHSYGFTSGVANSLFLFIACEVLFMIAATAILYSRGNNKYATTKKG